MWICNCTERPDPNERNLRKKYSQAFGRFVSIQWSRAKRPEEKGIEDKMRLTQQAGKIRHGLGKVKVFDIEFEVNFSIRYKVILSSVMPKVNKQRFASSWRYRQSAFLVVLV
jgi:hypothetical protein